MQAGGLHSTEMLLVLNITVCQHREHLINDLSLLET